MITAKDLRTLSTLRDFSDAEIEILLAAAPARAIPSGVTFCVQGEPGRSCFLLARGVMQVERAGAAGTQVVATVRPGMFVGQLALVDRGVRVATVRATADSEGLELARDAFERLLSASSPLALRFQEQIAVAGIRQHRDALRRLASLPVASAGPQGATQRKARDGILALVQTTTGEWGLSLDELDAVEVVAFDTGAKTPSPPRVGR